MKRYVTSVAGYGISIVLSAVVTLITIPVLIGRVGPLAWAGLAVGQAVGTGAAVVIGFGWGTTGPVDVARANGTDRRRIYEESLRARILIAGPVLAIAVIVAHVVSPAVRAESDVNAFGYGLTGLLAGWYFSGVARPYLFLLYDTFPRVLGAAVGVAVVWAGAPLMAFPVLQSIGVIGGVMLTTRHILGRRVSVLARVRWRHSVAILRGQSHGMVLAFASAGYAALPLAIVAVLVPAAAPAYALMDKLLRFATTGYAPIVQFLQGWVPGGSVQKTRDRIRLAFGGGAVMTAVGGVLFVSLTPAASRALSHGQVDPEGGLVWGFAAVLVCMVLSQIAGLVCLLSMDKAKQVALYTAVGVAVGLPVVVLGAVLAGAVGAVWMVAVGEGVMLVLQVRLLLSSMKRGAGPVSVD